jgi:hypothetical protein
MIHANCKIGILLMRDARHLRTFDKKKRMKPLSECRTVIFRFVCISLFFLLAGKELYGQYMRGPATTYLGVEAAVARRTFTLASNIPELNHLATSEEGFNVGFVIGSEAITSRLKFGSFKSGRLVREKIKMVEGEVGVNVFPLYLLKRKSKLLKPYSLISFELANLQFIGTYQIPKPPAGSSSHMGCPDEEPVAEEEEEPVQPAPAPEIIDKETVLGKVKVSRFNLGAGVNIHIPGERNFVNLFAEVKYGWKMGVKAMDSGFDGTNVSTQLAVNIGVSFGLSN